MKHLYTTLYFCILVFNTLNSQVLISTNPLEQNIDNNTMLKLASNDQGILFPRIALQSTTDITTIPNPREGLVVFNINNENNLTYGFYFYDGTKWTNIFNDDKVKSSFDLIENKTKETSSVTVIDTFPTIVETFRLGTGTSGWHSINLTETIDLERINNTVSISVEGMTQINNTQANTYQYAIGVFVDGSLQIVRKFAQSPLGRCSWHKFNLNGLAKDLAVGNHEIEIRVRNLQKTTTNFNEVAYGGNVSNCSNLNQFVGKIVLNTQIVQQIN